MQFQWINPIFYGKPYSVNLFGLSHNKFNGQIPSFSMAKNLIEINLSFNDLGGGINSTGWEELINLVNLDLGYNSIEGSIPMSLFSHPSIQKLQLSNNKFSGGLQEFNFSSYPLDTLDLSSNNLEGPLLRLSSTSKVLNSSHFLSTILVAHSSLMGFRN